MPTRRHELDAKRHARSDAAAEPAAGEAATSARDFLPERRTLPSLRRAAAECRGCPLYRHATQTVFGEGTPSARLMFVGEMPGDREDLAGRPFVGPAGRLLDDALDAAGIERRDAYVTNVVKHFKWTPRGKRRLHRTPSIAEIRACMPWLEAEIELVKPHALVCLGATAAKALLGRDFLVSRDRGRFVDSPLAPRVSATVHPSSLLRMQDRDERDAAFEQLVADLAAVRAALDHD
ncbi:MAG TPA: UdgX family uracil-DNA binding protein [Gammaproteobacteria bacterium]